MSDSAVAAGEAFVVSLSGQVLRQFRIIPAVHAHIDPDDVPEIRAHPLVDYLEPDLPTYHTLSRGGRTTMPGSVEAGWSLLSTQDTSWAVERIQAPDVWSQTTGSGVYVMVLDTGIESTHPDLDPSEVRECDGSDGEDVLGHGTEVSGLIAAQANGVGVIGAAYDVDLVSVRLDGDRSFAHSAVVCGIEEALYFSKGTVEVVSMSFGGVESNASVADAINEAYSEGILLVAGVGNEEHTAVTFPASMGAVIGVVGIDDQDTVDPEMPSGSQVELAAPGELGSIKTTCLDESYCLAPGDRPGGGGGGEICEDPHDEDNCVHDGASSYATPLVSAAAALLMEHNPSWTNVDVREHLRASAEDLGPSGRDDDYGYGLVQVDDALNYQMPDPPDVTIQGPLEIQPEATCRWDADVTDGHEPLTYEWYANLSSVGTDDHYTGGNPSGNTNSYFELKVVVTDYVGRTDEHSVTVDLDSEAPVCII